MNCNSYDEITIILRALTNHKRLRRISLSGAWETNENDLMAFVQLPAHSLKYLVFYCLLVVGSWSTTLGAIAHATNGVLKVFKARHVSGIDIELDTEDKAPSKSEVTASDLACFKCPVEWTKWYATWD
jgi:hypothetical protein